MELHWNAEHHILGTKVPQMKHNLRQEKLYSTVTLHSDQPTRGIALECGIHLLGIQNVQSESLWHLTKKGNKSKFDYIFEITKNDKPIRIYSFKDVSIFRCTDRISSSCRTWDCTTIWSFKYQAQKYPKEVQPTARVILQYCYPSQ